MKNKLYIAFIFIGSILRMNAQNENSGFSRLAYKFPFIDTSSIQTDFFVDISDDPDFIKKFYKEKNNLVDFNDTKRLLSNLRKNSIKNANVLGTDSIKIDLMTNLLNQKINPIFIVNCEVTEIKDSKLTELKFDSISQNYTTDFFDSNFLQKKEIFIASPVTYSFGQDRKMKFIIPKDLFISQRNTKDMILHIYFGNKMLNVYFDQTFEIDLNDINSSEIISLKLLDLLPTGDLVEIGSSDFKIGNVKGVVDYLKDFSLSEISADIEWEGKRNSGLVICKYGKGNSSGCIKKPFIFVEGIDFGYPGFENWEFCSNGKCGNLGFIDIYTGIKHEYFDQKENGKPLLEFQRGQYFFDGLFDLGYDVIYLDFKNGADYIQRNAMVLVKLIQEINNKKCSREDIVICGASMGGQVMRYALLYMQKNALKSCVRNSIYFDSPNKGANIPLGLQLFLDYYAVANPHNKFDEMVQTIDNKLNRPAARQLLIKHVSSGFSRSNDLLFSRFYGELMSMGNFPKIIRKVAIPSGSTSGNPLTSNNTGELMFDVRNIFFKSKFYAVPGDPNNNNFLFSGDRFGAGNMQTFYCLPGENNIDLCPGGKNYVVNEVAENLNKALGSSPTDKRNRAKAYVQESSFVSTNSSLGMATGDLNLNYDQTFQWIDFTDGKSCSFDSYYKHVNNSRHCELTSISSIESGNIPWTFNEIQRSQNIVYKLPSSYTYIDKSLGYQTKQVSMYNFGTTFKNTFGNLEIYNGGVCGFNLDLPSDFGFSDDLYHGNNNHYQGSTIFLHSSECGAEVEINDGGIFQLGDQNQPVNNKAHVFFRDGSYLRLYKGSKLIIHNGSKLIIEPGATLYIDAENVIQLEGPDAVIEIQGALVVKPGVNLKLTQQGFIKFATGADGISHIKLDLDPASAVELSSQTNDKRLEIGPGLMIEWPRQVSVKLDGIQADIGNNSGMVFNGPVDLHYVEFYGGAKSNSIVIHTPDQNNIHISGCYFGNFKTGLDFTNTSQYTTLTIDKCQFDQCNVGIQSDSMGLNLTHCSFNGCTTGWKANKVNHPSELYYTHFYMNDNMLDYTANVSRAELLFSWVTATNAGLKVNQTINANAKMSMRCSNFKNGSFDISGVRLNLSTLETHASLNSQNQPSLVHAGKNVFDNTPIYINSLWSFILENGKNDFTGHSGQPYIVGTIENARFSGNLNINDNYIKNFQQGQNVVLGYIKSGNIKYTILATTSGTLAASQFGGCSGSGGVDGDGLKPEFAAPQITQSGISCFPNPASHELNIVSNDFNYSDIRLLDVNGRTLKEYTATEDGTIPKVLDISWLPPGLYVLVVSDDNGNFKSQKFAISR